MDDFWPTILGAILAGGFGIAASWWSRRQDNTAKFAQARAALRFELENRFAGYEAIEWKQHDYLTIPRLIRVVETSHTFENHSHELDRLPDRIRYEIHEHYAHSREIVAVISDMWSQIRMAESLQLAQGGPQTIGINQTGLNTLKDELDTVFRGVPSILELLKS